jgi:hypothetical protein
VRLARRPCLPAVERDRPIDIDEAIDALDGAWSHIVGLLHDWSTSKTALDAFLRRRFEAHFGLSS